MGEAEKEALRAKSVEPHGLVIATRTPRQVTDLFYWYMTPDYDSSRDESEIGLPKLWDNFEEGEGKEHETYALVNNDLEGYKYNMAIRTERKADYEAGYYGAIKAAADFEIEVPAPAASTGWYLPSAGQWFDVLRNLAGVELSDTESSFFLIDDYGNFSWMNKGRVNDILNECMAHVADNMTPPTHRSATRISTGPRRPSPTTRPASSCSTTPRSSTAGGTESTSSGRCAPYSDSDRKGSDPTGRKPSAASAAEGPGHRPQAKAGGKDRGKKGAAGHDAPRIRLAHTGNGPCAQSEIKKRQVAYFRATCFFRMASTSAKASRRKSADSTT